MTNGDSPLDFIPTAEEFSWIGSILPLGGVFGAILCAPLPSGIGRKNCLLLSAVFFAVSFALLMFTSDLPSIYTARFFQGVGSSLVMVVLPIYIGEIASPECRGILSSFIQIGLVGEFYFAIKNTVNIVLCKVKHHLVSVSYQWEFSMRTRSVPTCHTSHFNSSVCSFPSRSSWCSHLCPTRRTFTSHRTIERVRRVH